MFITPTIFNHFINHWFSVSFIFDYFYRMKENAIKCKKIVVDVQNIVFYRRSIELYGDSYMNFTEYDQ